MSRLAAPERRTRAGRVPRIVIEETVRIPAGINDFDGFRRWTHSNDFPDQGWISYLGDELWIDLSMEELLFHNQVKGEFAYAIMSILKGDSLGRYFHDRARLSNPKVGLGTEPDGMFASWQAFRSKRVRLIPGADERYVELEGTPEMVLEIVSPKSARKDTVVLRQLYWEAGVAEYWLVNPLEKSPRFEILRRGPKGYVATRPQGGWLKSTVFGRSFRLTQLTDALGHPQYTVEVRT